MLLKVISVIFLFSVILTVFKLSSETVPHIKVPAEAQVVNEFSPNPPTIDTIFSDDHSWTATLSAERKRVVIATGDVIPARVVNIQATKLRNYIWPFEKTADVLRNADITFINLETPLLKDCPLKNDGFTFCGSDKNLEGLVFAGVDVASLANNHAGNYGAEGINATVDLLKSQGILATGRDGAVYKNIRGVTFAFLGYNDIGQKLSGISSAEEQKIQSDIADARHHASIVIVTFHWGTEYQDLPNVRQKYLGRFTLDAGADLVIGNHPHWIQPVEMYKGKLIMYAHGNFVFDQEWSLKTKQGVVGRYTFYDNHLVDAEYLPIQIENYGQPHFLSGPKKQALVNEMKKNSQSLSN